MTGVQTCALPISIDDPKICLLVVVDNPANGASGSLSAGPAAKEILENTLKYMLVKPK